MTSFRRWRETSGEEGVTRRIAYSLAQIGQLEREVEELLGQLSHDASPVQMAMDKFRTSFEVLQSALKTAVIKHQANPERADHPPVSTTST